MAEPDKNDPPTLDYSGTPRQRRWWPLLLFLGLLFLVIALSAALLLPSDNPPHPVSNRLKSASNLREIGQAIWLYTQDHNGEYPDSFETILLNEDITPAVFVSPESHDSPADGATTQE